MGHAASVVVGEGARRFLEFGRVEFLRRFGFLWIFHWANLVFFVEDFIHDLSLGIPFTFSEW